MRTPLVTLKNVSAGYYGKQVLSEISLDIYENDFVGVTGPNGGGKTTLIKVILGLLPHSGTITYAGSLTSGGAWRIGYLPQQNAFDRSFPISVVDVVASGLQAEKGFLRRYKDVDFSQARRLLETAGIGHLERRSIGDVSGGEMQRVLLCRALIAGPRLLILDEPNTFVDSRFEHELYGLLRKLNEEQGVAVVMVSHNNATIATVATSRVNVENGTIKRQDYPLIA